MTGCHKRESITFIFISGKVGWEEQWQEVLSLLFPFFYTGTAKAVENRLAACIPSTTPNAIRLGAITRDSVTNRFNGVPLLGPNSMMEWLGWARAMNGAWNQR